MIMLCFYKQIRKKLGADLMSSNPMLPRDMYDASTWKSLPNAVQKPQKISRGIQYACHYQHLQRPSRSNRVTNTLSLSSQRHHSRHFVDRRRQLMGKSISVCSLISPGFLCSRASDLLQALTLFVIKPNDNVIVFTWEFRHIKTNKFLFGIRLVLW